MADQSDIVSVVQKRITYIQLMEQCGSPVGSAEFERCHRGHLGLDQGNEESFSIDDAMAMKEIVETVFSPSQVETIMSSLHQKVNLASTVPSGDPNRNDKQDNNSFDKYLHEYDLASFRDAKVDPGTKLSNLGTKFLKFGILSPVNK